MTSAGVTFGAAGGLKRCVGNLLVLSRCALSVAYFGVPANCAGLKGISFGNAGGGEDVRYKGMARAGTFIPFAEGKSVEGRIAFSLASLCAGYDKAVNG